MYVAVEGCAHGALDEIYGAVQELERANGIKVDLLICCGDFQSTRDEHDLQHMACPQKFRRMNSFPQYFSGEKEAPVLTVFVGGNHEASNYLYDMYYGGWVAPNIYFLGHSGCINVGGIRIAGVSGIYKDYDFGKPLYERFPLSEKHCRSVYHMRSWECYKLAHLTGNVDVMISHDWPTIVTDKTEAVGDTDQLMRFKDHFADQIKSASLGNPMTSKLLKWIRPAFWFSAHLHAKFASIIQHADCSNIERPFIYPSHSVDRTTLEGYSSTRFLALDKCLPGKKFLQILNINGQNDVESASEGVESSSIQFDYEWLTILRKTASHMPTDTSSYSTKTSFENISINERDIEETKQLIYSWKQKIGLPSNDNVPTETFDSGDPVHNYRILAFYEKLGLSLPGRITSCAPRVDTSKKVSSHAVDAQASSAVKDDAALDIDEL